jgi:hypothetical protein
MIRLGFISNLDQAPAGIPLVRTARAGDNGSGTGPSVLSVPDRKGRPRIELTFAAPVSDGNGGSLWPADMAKAINGLGWTVWRFDPLSPATVLGGGVEKSLMDWGEAFWPALDMDCDILLDVTGGGRSQVYQAVRAWEKKHPKVRFARELDLESASETKPSKPRWSLTGMFSRLFQSSKG